MPRNSEQSSEEIMENDDGVHEIQRNTVEFPIPFEDDDDINGPLALSLASPSSSSAPPRAPAQHHHHAPPTLPPPFTAGQPRPDIQPPPLMQQPAVLLPWFFYPENSLPLPPSSDVPFLPGVISTSTALSVPAINQAVNHRQEVLSGPFPRPPPRRGSNQQQNEENNVPAPYPWATDRRATVQTYKDLMEKKIDIIEGQVQCKRCRQKYQMRFNLTEKLMEVGLWFADHKDSMHDRAPERWKNPVLPNCQHCHEENCVKPIIINSGGEELEKVNWLFLLLGEMIGLCTLKQLRYFCTHTSIHRTGAKDRLVYQTYLTLFKQLLPEGPF